MTPTKNSVSKIVQHSSIYAIGTISRQIVSFLMLPIYTRYLTPADYGVVGLLMFTLALIEPFLGARLGDAIPKFYFDSSDHEHQKSVFASAFALTGVVSGLTTVFIYLTRREGSIVLFGSDAYSSAIGIFGIQILTQGIEYYGFTYIRIRQMPHLFIVVSLAKLVMQLSLNIWLIVSLKMGVLGVILSGAISSSIFCAGLTAYVLYENGLRFDPVLARRMLSFSWPLWLSGLAGLYILQSNRYYLRAFGSLEDVGLFELAFKFASILTMLIWNPFSQIWDVERFLIHRQSNSKQVFASAFRGITIVLMTTCLGISLFASQIIQLMSAPPFHRAGISVPFLCLATVFFSLTLFVNFSFLVSGQTKKISRNNYLTVAGVTAFNFAFIPRFAEVGAAIALMFAAILQYTVTVRSAHRHFDMCPDNMLLGKLTGGAIAIYVVADVIIQAHSIWVRIAVNVAAFALYFGVLARMLLTDSNMQPYIHKLTRILFARRT